MTGFANVVCGDTIDILPQWIADGFVCDTIVTDPPYHLGSISKRFGKADSAPAKHGTDGAAARLSKGFMGWDGDSGDVAFQPDTWRLMYDLLPPGGRLLAFGGSRTWWRIAAAVDDAGFEYEDTMMWVYGQGLVLKRTRLKPCFEPIMMFRKPGRVQELGIEECRVAGGKDVPASPSNTDSRIYGKNASLTSGNSAGSNPEIGRWPGNVILDGSPEVVACFPDAPGQIANARTDGAPQNNRVCGTLRHRGSDPSAERRYGNSGAPNFNAKPGVCRTDKGSAARFYNACEWTEEEQESRLVYQAKASGHERVFRCGICGEDFLHADRMPHAHGAVLPDGRPDLTHLRSHPTVKPVSLMQHLAKLVCPPGGLVLDPFAGTGSTLVGAMRAGRDAVGIERDATFAAHAKIRIDKG